MTLIHIKRQKADRNGHRTDVFVVPAVVIHAPQGKKLIPNPAGTETCTFDTLEDAVAAVTRNGFDYEFEGRKNYQYSQQPTGFSEVLSLWDSIPELMERLNDKEAGVIANAAFALGTLNATQAVEGLIEHLGHEDSTVRRHVAEALARMTPVSIPSLQQAYDNARGQREKNAAHARLTVMTAYLEMVMTRRPFLDRILPQVLEGLRDDHWLVRSQAALVVGHAAKLAENDE